MAVCYAFLQGIVYGQAAVAIARQLVLALGLVHGQGIDVALPLAAKHVADGSEQGQDYTILQSVTLYI